LQLTGKNFAQVELQLKFTFRIRRKTKATNRWDL